MDKNSKVLSDIENFKNKVEQLFYYDDGLLRRKSKPHKWSSADIGCIAGSLNTDGYVRVGIEYKSYQVHKIIYLLLTGTYPTYLDHIDGNRSNNRIENLRECSQRENNRNRRGNLSSSSKYKGVTKRGKKWEASIKKDKINTYIGIFDTEEEAALEYNKIATAYFGDFAKLNDIGELNEAV